MRINHQWLGLILLLLAPHSLSAAAAERVASPPGGICWRFEAKNKDYQTTLSVVPDESGRFQAVREGGLAHYAPESPDPAEMSAGARAFQGSIKLDGGCLRVKSAPELNLTRNFTVELWVKFGPPRAEGEILIAKGDPAKGGNWHLKYGNDGLVTANVSGGSPAHFFSPDSGGVTPGRWYRLAATYEDLGIGKTEIRTYVNGLPGGVSQSQLIEAKDTSNTDLIIGAYPSGKSPFHGQIAEVRLVPEVMGSRSGLPPPSAKSTKPFFVPAGTRIDDAVRAQAAGAPILQKAEGFPYFYRTATPFSVLRCGQPPEDYVPAFGWAIQGAAVNNGGSAASYHFAVKPGGKYVVAIGFYDPITSPPISLQRIAIDGKKFDPFNPAVEGRKKPVLRKYQTSDLNGDGFLQVAVMQALEETNFSGMMNAIWIFPDLSPDQIDDEKLMRGRFEVPPLYFVNCGREQETFPGHIAFPAMSDQVKAKMLPPRPMLNALDPDAPQPVDPLDLEIGGDLRDRLLTFQDMWGFAGRDQGLVGAFLSQCSFEVAGRYNLALYQLSRLMKHDYQMQVPFEALLARQDLTSAHPGSFVGGTPPRTAILWSQGVILSALMAHHEYNQDPRALAAAEKLADFYEYYLSTPNMGDTNYFSEEGKFLNKGSIVGQIGKGALRGMVWLYQRTNNPKHLATAQKIADLNRKYGGVASMIHGDIANLRPEYESHHVHANLSTVRGYPWLYAATGDRGCLEDAIKACDRVNEFYSWRTGNAFEIIYPLRYDGNSPATNQADPHDETCSTADFQMLSYSLGDLTGEGRFYDRGDNIYYNAIRYAQTHDGHFSAASNPNGPCRGSNSWPCCDFRGVQALCDAAIHLYAYSPSAVYVNGFMPSTVNLHLKGGTVRLQTEADIPRSGEVKITVTPQGIEKFTMNVRVPGWAVLNEVSVNGKALQVQPEKGYVKIARDWQAGDIVQVNFGLPLRVVLDTSFDAKVPAARVKVDGAESVEVRHVLVYRGPAVIAWFRLANGCDLCWAYSGDHPDLFNTIHSWADSFESNWNFKSNFAPPLTQVTNTPEGVKLEWGWRAGWPLMYWTVRRTALVRPEIPVRVDYTAEVTCPTQEIRDKMLATTRLCGVRMQSTRIGPADYHKVSLELAGKQIAFGDVAGKPLTAEKLALNNGYVQFTLNSDQNQFLALNDADAYAGIYTIPKPQGERQLTAQCSLTVTGQSQFKAPLIK